MLDGFSISLVVFYLQRGQICHIPYNARMASNTAQCTTLHTRDATLKNVVTLKSGSDVTPGH